MSTEKDYVVADIALADFGRKEITIAETEMPGVDPVPGWLYVAKTDHTARLRNEVERLRWIGAQAEFWPKERVREVLPSARYFDALHVANGFHIHPLNYTLGLAAAAEAAGVRIFENTEAIEIDPTGIRKRVSTPLAKLRADHVVLAGSLQIGGLMPHIGETLISISTFVVVTEPIANLSDVIRWQGAVSDGARADNHYRIVDGNRLLWSGRMRTREVDPRKFEGTLLRVIQRNFPALESVEAAYVWRGTLGRTVHRMPQIGEFERGLWLASGFGGHGLNTTAMAGELIARAIVDGDQTWRLFAPYELVWAGGRLGRTLVQGAYWVREGLVRAPQAMARYREKREKRAAQAEK